MLIILVVADCGDNSYMGYIIVSNLHVVLDLFGSFTQQENT